MQERWLKSTRRRQINVKRGVKQESTMSPKLTTNILEHAVNSVKY